MHPGSHRVVNIYSHKRGVYVTVVGGNTNTQRSVAVSGGMQPGTQRVIHECSVHWRGRVEGQSGRIR